jgi:hypothetical protein
MSSKSDTVRKMNENGTLSSDNLVMANHFNSFFTNVGQEISNSVPPVAKKPDNFLNSGRPIPPMLLGTTSEHVLKILKKLQNKNSCNIHGISTKMVKFNGPEIATPLTHIFHLKVYKRENFYGSDFNFVPFHRYLLKY